MTRSLLEMKAKIMQQIAEKIDARESESDALNTRLKGALKELGGLSLLIKSINEKFEAELAKKRILLEEENLKYSDLLSRERSLED